MLPRCFGFKLSFLSWLWFPMYFTSIRITPMWLPSFLSFSTSCSFLNSHMPSYFQSFVLSHLWLKDSNTGLLWQDYLSSFCHPLRDIQYSVRLSISLHLSSWALLLLRHFYLTFLSESILKWMLRNLMQKQQKSRSLSDLRPHGQGVQRLFIPFRSQLSIFLRFLIFLWVRWDFLWNRSEDR